MSGRYDSVVIDGVAYTVASAEEATYSLEPQFQRKEDDPLWYTWAMRSFHGGERLTNIISPDDIEQYRYDDGEGVDVTDWGELKLQPALELDYAVSSANMPMCVTSDGSRVILGLAATPYVKVWYDGSWTSATSVAGSGAVKHIIAAGTTLYAVRGGGVISSSNNGSSWSTVGSYTTAMGVAWVNDELIVLKSDGVYNHTADAEISTTGGTSIADYRESVYWIADQRLYRYDGVADYIYCRLPPGFVGAALISYRLALLIVGYYKVQGGYKASIHYIIQGMENHLYTLGDYSADHRVYAATGDDQWMVIASPQRGGVDIYQMDGGGLSSGPALGEAANIPFMSLAICDGYLFMGRYDNDSDTDGVYKANLANPSTYRSSGWLTTSEWDFGLSQSKKLWRSITVEARRLQANESVIVYYSTNGGSTWRVAGTVTPGSLESHEFILTKVESYAIKVKLKLCTSTGASSPTVTEVRVMGAPVVEAKWRWLLMLDMFSQSGGHQQITALRRVASNQEVVLFKDMAGESSYVMIDRLEFRQHPGDPWSAQAVVSLKEI